MKTIADEVREFTEATGVKQKELALASGVPASTICNLVKGRRKNVFGFTQDALRKAMMELANEKQN